jgi:uncharacterized membrane protein YoaK (UPF0700 family)
MPISYLRKLVARDRNQRANRHLGGILAFVAGAVNVCSFIALQQYTSHISGVVSSIAAGAALGNIQMLLGGLLILLSFTFGASSTALLISWGRRRNLHSQYAVPLLFEAVMLAGFCLLGYFEIRHHLLFVPLSIAGLCFVMGMQNALITKLSNAEIRTTHLTGMVTDIGIELGKLAYRNRSKRSGGSALIVGSQSKLKLLSILVLLFFFGGVSGAVGFEYAGYAAVLPLSCLLGLLAMVPILDDLSNGRTRRGAGAARAAGSSQLMR